MPNLFSKHLHLCFFKLKHPAIPSSPPPSSDHHLINSPTFHFNSTYNYDATSSTTDDYFSSSSNSSSSDFTTDLPLPDFASIFASQRFFFSSPGTSNSIVQSPDTSIPRGGGVRVPKYSVNPYLDFLRSMQEMIQSHHVLVDVRKDWDYLHELLLCYLALNPPHTHKYIVRAFTDLVVDLLSSGGVKNRHHRRQSSFSGRLV